MSLLGLLDRMPDLEALYDAPVFPSVMDELESPLSPEETEDWNDIVSNLGDLAMRDDDDLPIWREVSAKYASLLLGPEPMIGETWGGDDWISADFDDMWNRPSPIWSQVAANRFYDSHVLYTTPPEGYRSPTGTLRDKTSLADDQFERIIAGLRRL